MTNSAESSAYATVIKDLRRQRDEIDRMIVRLEALAAGNPVPVSTESAQGTDTSVDHSDEANSQETPATEGEFLGMKIVDAARIVLSRRRKPMKPADITADLEQGGLLVSSSNTVASVLHRRGREVGDIVSPKRGLWGLKEWYPGRSFGKSEAPPDKGSVTVPDTAMPLSQRMLIAPNRKRETL